MVVHATLCFCMIAQCELQIMLMLLIFCMQDGAAVATFFRGMVSGVRNQLTDPERIKQHLKQLKTLEEHQQEKGLSVTRAVQKEICDHKKEMQVALITLQHNAE